MKKLIVLSLIILSGIMLRAGALEETLRKANTLYNAERYEEAAKLYQQIVDSDIVSARLYYNLGNAYYKSNKLPEAIYYYEKAKKLDPANEDIAHNLKIANGKIVDKLEEVPEVFFAAWWKSRLQMFSPDQWTIISLSLFFIIFLLASIFFLSRNIRVKKMSFYGGILVIILTAFSFYFAYRSYQTATQHNEAVIFAPSVVVKSSPNEKSVDLFVIHEGLKVDILENENNWSKIKIGNGKIGWIPQEVFKKI